MVKIVYRLLMNALSPPYSEYQAQSSSLLLFLKIVSIKINAICWNLTKFPDLSAGCCGLITFLAVVGPELV